MQIQFWVSIQGDENLTALTVELGSKPTDYHIRHIDKFDENTT